MVIYLVCFDLSQPEDKQMQQITFWLEYLNSTLTAARSTSTTVMIFGTRSDIKNPVSNISSSSIRFWQNKFKNIPLYKSELFTISSLQVKDSVVHLLDAITTECHKIFDILSLKIPTSYIKLIDFLEQLPISGHLMSVKAIHQRSSVSVGLDLQGVQMALRHLHHTGHVVMLDEDTVCTNPTIVPKIVAKFISPEDVRKQILTSQQVSLLDNHQIDCLLDIHDASDYQYVILIHILSLIN